MFDAIKKVDKLKCQSYFGNISILKRTTYFIPCTPTDQKTIHLI